MYVAQIFFNSLNMVGGRAGFSYTLSEFTLDNGNDSHCLILKSWIVVVNTILITIRVSGSKKLIVKSFLILYLSFMLLIGR